MKKPNNENIKTFLEQMQEINKLAKALLIERVKFMQEKQRRANAIVFFCQHGKFPDEI